MDQGSFLWPHASKQHSLAVYNFPPSSQDQQVPLRPLPTPTVSPVCPDCLQFKGMSCLWPTQDRWLIPADMSPPSKRKGWMGSRFFPQSRGSSCLAGGGLSLRGSTSGVGIQVSQSDSQDSGMRPSWPGSESQRGSWGPAYTPALGHPRAQHRSAWVLPVGCPLMAQPAEAVAFPLGNNWVVVPSCSSWPSPFPLPRH